MIDGRLLVRVLTDPGYAKTLSPKHWADLLAMAQAERLLGSLAHRLDGLSLPKAAQRVLEAARLSAQTGRVQALWEAEMARRALAPLNVPVVLLKGTAFAAMGLDAAQGRQIGDLDILVPRDRIDEVETALIGAGWQWVKPDPYDDAYYRQHMHELPPLIHRDRDRMIDVHHTILPLTARITPDPAALIAASLPLENGLRILCPEDMIVHAAAHLFADGDLAGGLRNLWDIDRMVREFSVVVGFWTRLLERSRLHGLTLYVSRALRLCLHLYDTPVDKYLAWDGRKGDLFYTGRLLARDGWGRETRKILRFAFYVRSHRIRMPPLMLARHLWAKWRRAP
jgi:hypothetical protein